MMDVVDFLWIACKPGRALSETLSYPLRIYRGLCLPSFSSGGIDEFNLGRLVIVWVGQIVVYKRSMELNLQHTNYYRACVSNNRSTSDVYVIYMIIKYFAYTANYSVVMSTCQIVTPFDPVHSSAPFFIALSNHSASRFALLATTPCLDLTVFIPSPLYLSKTYLTNFRCRSQNRTLA